jgi:hypothetical protein
MKKIIIILLVLLGLQTQAQINPCDSITYWIDPSQGFNVGLDTTGVIHNPDSIDVFWQACTNGQCYGGNGMFTYFGQIMTTDTVKLCYDVMLYTSNTVEVCTHCDSLVYDGFSWVLFSMSNPTSINELTFNRINDDKIYDLLGRELEYIPAGKMYIRNNKLYMSK